MCDLHVATANKSSENWNGTHFESLMTKIGYIKRQFVCTKSHVFLQSKWQTFRYLIRSIRFSSVNLSLSLVIFCLPVRVCECAVRQRQMQIKWKRLQIWIPISPAKRNEAHHNFNAHQHEISIWIRQFKWLHRPSYTRFILWILWTAYTRQNHRTRCKITTNQWWF